MSIIHSHHAAIEKLKKRLRSIEKKEVEGRKKLQLAMNNARKVAKSYQLKLHSKLRDIRGKHAVEKASAYACAAVDVERKFIKEVQKKSKHIKTAVARMDVRSVMKLINSITSKVFKSAVKPAAKKARKKK